MKTEYEVFLEGVEGFQKEEKNPYLLNTWAYRAWSRGYDAARRKCWAY